MLIESIIRRRKGTTVTLGDTSYHFGPTPVDERHIAPVDDQAHIAMLLAIKEGFRPADGSHVALAGALAQEIDGPYFVLRGPQDLQALRQWCASNPSMLDEPAEYVALVDKIALGEADLGGFALVAVPDIPLPSVPAFADGTPASGHSRQTPAPTNSIIPDQGQAGDSTGADASDDEASGHGGGGAAGGTAADSAEAGATESAATGGAGAGTSDAHEAGDDLDREALAEQYKDIHGHRPNGKWSAEKIAQVMAEQA